VKVECLRSAHELDQLGFRWKWLESQRDYTVFQKYELNRCAAEWFADRESPHVVVAESGSGLAIIPAVRREREVSLIGETLFDYRDVLAAGDTAVLDAAWQELARLKLPLEVTALRGDQVRERWGRFDPKPFCNAPCARYQDISSSQFVSAHHKSAKASRRLRRQGLHLMRRSVGLDRYVNWVYRRKQEWTGHSENLFLDPIRQEFMQHVAKHGVSDCKAWTYETGDGDIAAVLITLESPRHRHFYTIHHDARWEQFSPGQVMIFDVTRESLAEGLDVDYMTGEYPYKNRIATSKVPLYRIQGTEPMSKYLHQTAGYLSPAA
jgi:CelD/BcsL family acetyltransferase involved in cellulose biosynthesis